MAPLIVLSGLPGVGKSTTAKQLAAALPALWLQVDTIEKAVRAAGVLRGSISDAGYKVAYALARENLAAGNAVVADAVNPWMLTRDGWVNVALEAGAALIEVELVCTDVAEHRRRVEARAEAFPEAGHPGWTGVVERDYRPWERERLVIDTAAHAPQSVVALIRAALRTAGPPLGGADGVT